MHGVDGELHDQQEDTQDADDQVVVGQASIPLASE